VAFSVSVHDPHHWADLGHAVTIVFRMAKPVGAWQIGPAKPY